MNWEQLLNQILLKLQEIETAMRTMKVVSLPPPLPAAVCYITPDDLHIAQKNVAKVKKLLVELNAEIEEEITSLELDASERD